MIRHLRLDFIRLDQIRWENVLDEKQFENFVNIEVFLNNLHSRPLFHNFRLFHKQLSVSKCLFTKSYRFLDSNLGPLVWEASALSTVPQSLPMSKLTFRFVSDLTLVNKKNNFWKLNIFLLLYLRFCRIFPIQHSACRIDVTAVFAFLQSIQNRSHIKWSTKLSLKTIFRIFL